MIEAAEIGGGPELQWLLKESNELSAIFNQSQLTAKANAVPWRTGRTQCPAERYRR
jgi:hypothetical protein